MKAAANHESGMRPTTDDWGSVGRSLDAHGNAVLPGLLTAKQCGALAALYQRKEGFRTRIVMARHGFGRGEYKYFAYPLPPLASRPATSCAVSLAGTDRQSLEPATGDRHAVSRRAGRISTPVPPGRTDAADSADPSVRRGRLQLPSPGSLRRACVSAAGHHSIVGAWQRFRRR
jgi:hypothetical protein